MRERWAVLHRFCFGGVDPVRLDSFRRIFALNFLLYQGTWFLDAFEWLTPYGFHYTAATTPPPYPAPLPLLTPGLVPLYGLALLVGAMLVIAGKRRAVWLLLALAVWVQLADIVAAYTLNKLYIVGFAVLALAPAPRPVEHGGRTTSLQSAWPLRVLQATLLIQYFTAGTCKVLPGNWFEHSDILWTHVQGIYRTEFAAWMLRVLPKDAWAGMMYSALAFELLAPFLFAYRRTRPLAFAWGFSFQAIIALTMYRLFFFSAQMLTFYILFVDADTLHAARRWLAEGRDLFTRFLRNCWSPTASG
jgi:hypothetical protein